MYVCTHAQHIHFLVHNLIKEYHSLASLPRSKPKRVGEGMIDVKKERLKGEAASFKKKVVLGTLKA